MGKKTQPALQIEHVAIDDLHPDPANPRRIADAELEALTRSIRQFGLIDPIIARHDDKIVIGGHQRLLAARKLGLETVPVVFVDLPPEKARLLNVALNKISGDWDWLCHPLTWSWGRPPLLGQCADRSLASRNTKHDGAAQRTRGGPVTLG